MPYDYSKLDGKIKEIFGNRRSFAKAINFSERTLSLKMNGRIPWKQTDISKACVLLDIAEVDIPIYFFTLKVQCVEL